MDTIERGLIRLFSLSGGGRYRKMLFPNFLIISKAFDSFTFNFMLLHLLFSTKKELLWKIGVAKYKLD